MSAASRFASSLVRTAERLGIRGAPTLFGLVSRWPRARRMCSSVELPSGRRIRFPTFDPYWARYLWAGAAYEPDVELILRRLGAIGGKLFVDCGANIGYWTVRASEPEFGCAEFVAIEANPRLVPILRENMQLNAIPCEVIAAAVAEKSGESVLLGGTEHHAVASVGASGVPVPTVSLADVISRHSAARRGVVVKLDVEGSEVAALRGAPRGEEIDIIYIVEDWPRSGMPVTHFLVEEGYGVLGVAPDGRAEQLRSVEQAIEFNRRSTKAYGPSNLVACDREKLSSLIGLFGVGSGTVSPRPA